MAEGIVDLLEEVDIYEYEAYLQFSLFRVRQAMQQMIDIAAIEKAGEKVGVGFFFFLSGEKAQLLILLLELLLRLQQFGIAFLHQCQKLLIALLDKKLPQENGEDGDGQQGNQRIFSYMLPNY